jgi:hypothetical protein
LLLACALLEPAWAAPEGVPAVWKTQELRFDYIGFTSKYSCDGLRDKVESVLLLLGARRDLEVRPFGCSRMGAPESLPSLQIKVSTLIPAGQGDVKDALEAKPRRNIDVDVSRMTNQYGLSDDQAAPLRTILTE